MTGSNVDRIVDASSNIRLNTTKPDQPQPQLMKHWNNTLISPPPPPPLTRTEHRNPHLYIHVRTIMQRHRSHPRFARPVYLDYHGREALRDFGGAVCCAARGEVDGDVTELVLASAVGSVAA